MKIGYARISTKDQNLEGQIETLKQAGCERIFSEQVSGRKARMPEFDNCMAFLREGDSLVVRHIDRLNRGTLELLMLYEELKKRKITLISVLQPVDFSDPTLGKLFFQIFSMFAECEHNIASERSYDGMMRARERGGPHGRPPKLTPEKQGLLCDAYQTKKHTIKELARMFDVGTSAIMRYTQEFRHG